MSVKESIVWHSYCSKPVENNFYWFIGKQAFWHNFVTMSIFFYSIFILLAMFISTLFIKTFSNQRNSHYRPHITHIAHGNVTRWQYCCVSSSRWNPETVEMLSEGSGESEIKQGSNDEYIKHIEKRHSLAPKISCNVLHTSRWF